MRSDKQGTVVAHNSSRAYRYQMHPVSGDQRLPAWSRRPRWHRYKRFCDKMLVWLRHQGRCRRYKSNLSPQRGAPSFRGFVTRRLVVAAPRSVPPLQKQLVTKCRSAIIPRFCDKVFLWLRLQGRCRHYKSIWDPI